MPSVGSDTGGDVRCSLTLGSDSDAVEGTVRAAGNTGVTEINVAAVVHWPASMQLVSTVAAPTTAALACGDNNSSVRGGSIKITAIPLGGQHRTVLP